MQVLVLLSLAVAACSAYPGYYVERPILGRSDYRLQYPYYPWNQYHKQYHNQDALGQYNFAYDTLDNARSEVRDAFGRVVGSYTYLDAEGKLQTVNYRADERGFNAAGTNIPDASTVVDDLKPIEETEEVKLARAEHLKAHEDFLAGRYVLPVAPEVPVVLDVPMVPETPELKQIDDEPEVALARKEFFDKYDAAVALLKKAELGENILTTPAPTDLPEPVTDEPVVAKAKKEHIELQKALSEHNEILRKLMPEPIEYVRYPAWPYSRYTWPYMTYP